MQIKNLGEQIFGSHIKYLKLFALYEVENYEKISKFYNYFVYFFLTVPVPILAMIRLYLIESVELMDFIQNFSIALQLSANIIKNLQFIMNYNIIKKTIYYINSEIFSNLEKRHEHYMERHMTIVTRIFQLFFISCMSCATLWSLAPILMKNYEPPLALWTPFEAKIGSLTHILLYIYTCLAGFISAVTTALIDSLIAFLAYHASTQVQILNDQLLHLNQDVENQLSDNIPNRIQVKSEIVYKKISGCVIHHLAILEFIEYFQKSFSVIVFAQFSASIFVICTCCFHLTVIEPFTVAFFAILNIDITILLQVFFSCFFGTILFEESSSIISSIYLGEWYELDVKSKKALLLIMERAQKPILVTVGHILDLSLSTFTMVVRRAYSVSAVLRNYNNK